MTDQPQDGATIRNMPITVHAQYIKDMSFENPGVPTSLQPNAIKPNLDLGINVGVQDLTSSNLPGMFEVSLRISAKAKSDDKTIFIAEIDYAASVSIGTQVPEDSRHPLLMIEIPRILFPYARMMLSQMTQQGGYPALNIAPVDFQSLYMQKFTEELKAGQKKAAQN